MEEAKKSGPAVAAKSRAGAEEPTTRTFVAVRLQHALAKQSSTPPVNWSQASPQEQKRHLQQINHSMRLWTVRELAGFRGVKLPEKFTPQETQKFLEDLMRPDSKVKAIKPTIKRTPTEIKAARQQLTIEAFGARLVKGPLGWLSLSPELRESASRDFDHELQKWVGEQKFDSQVSRVRQISVQTWMGYRERTSAAARGTTGQNIAPARKDKASDAER